MKLNEQRRSSLKKIAFAVTGIFGFGVAKAAERTSSKKVVGTVVEDQNIPLFSGAVKHGNTLYVAGKGAHFETCSIEDPLRTSSFSSSFST